LSEELSEMEELEPLHPTSKLDTVSVNKPCLIILFVSIVIIFLVRMNVAQK